MSKINIICLVLLVLFFGCALPDKTSDGRKDNLPNIIILFADDWGYGDVGAYGNLPDVKTPHLDALSKQGVLFTDAYVTAPQCSPSRAGLMTGRYQQRFGFDGIQSGPLSLDETTIAERLQSAGYITGMVGKWHLQPNIACVAWVKKNYPAAEVINGRANFPSALGKPYWPGARGFDEFFTGELNTYMANFDLEGNKLKSNGELVKMPEYRIDTQTKAGLGFIERNADKPFFLYLAHYAPHVPLEATEKYLKRFPGEMPERRRTALAMMSAVDDGVGQIMQLLRDKGIADNTFVMFASDNGAPLGAQKLKPMEDVLPVDKSGAIWDGSRNDPLTGEKGMLAEGGIRIPMIWSWPAKLPKGIVVNEPVISLDMTASALAATKESEEAMPEELDGLDLIPWLSGVAESPRRILYWRFWNQAAIRRGNWKYYFNGDGRKMLFNLHRDKEERHNVINKHKKTAAHFHKKMRLWTEELQPVGLPSKGVNIQEKNWHEYYFGEKKQSRK